MGVLPVYGGIASQGGNADEKDVKGQLGSKAPHPNSDVLAVGEDTDFSVEDFRLER